VPTEHAKSSRYAAEHRAEGPGEEVPFSLSGGCEAQKKDGHERRQGGQIPTKSRRERTITCFLSGFVLTDANIFHEVTECHEFWIREDFLRVHSKLLH